MSGGARRRRSPKPPEGNIRLELDDETTGRLMAAAAVRGMPPEVLIAELLVAASTRIDELLDGPASA
ncbi:MAG TPA: hypothetical protein VF230_16855 [Acidimicrobiales bacterium]